MSDKQVKDYDKFVLRLPEGMREAIADLAKRNGRSMNAEIVQILKDALTKTSFELIASKEALRHMPIDLRTKLIGQRTKLARIAIAQAMRDIDENLELLSEAEQSISEEEINKIQKHVLYYDKEALEEFRKKQKDMQNKKPT